MRFERQQLREVLPLVVANAPRIDATVANGRFEGWALPEFEWVRRLHVVVAIEQDGRLVRRHVAPAQHHRMVPCRHSFCFHAEGLQHVHKHGREFANADIVRAYAGVAYIVHHARDECLAVDLHMIKQLLEIGIDDAHWRLSLSGPDDDVSLADQQSSFWVFRSDMKCPSPDVAIWPIERRLRVRTSGSCITQSHYL